MTKRGKYGRMFSRFLRYFVETHTSVVGDIAGVAIVFQGEQFLPDLVYYQITRKLSGIGLRDTTITFLLQDQGFLDMVK